MKKKIQQVPQEAQKTQETNIELLEQYAKKFIKEAITSNLNREQALQILRINWVPVYVEVYPLSEETPAEKKFRKKASKFLNCHYEKISSYINSFEHFDVGLPVLLQSVYFSKFKQPGSEKKFQWSCMEEYYNLEAPIETSIFLEALCACYKVFSDLDHFSVENIITTACNRLNKIYILYFNQQRTYVKTVISWFRRYLKTLDKSNECLAFINSYECASALERDICHLMYLIENC